MTSNRVAVNPVLRDPTEAVGRQAKPDVACRPDPIPAAIFPPPPRGAEGLDEKRRAHMSGKIALAANLFL